VGEASAPGQTRSAKTPQFLANSPIRHVGTVPPRMTTWLWGHVSNVPTESRPETVCQIGLIPRGFWRGSTRGKSGQNTRRAADVADFDADEIRIQPEILSNPDLICGEIRTATPRFLCCLRRFSNIKRHRPFRRGASVRPSRFVMHSNQLTTEA